MNQLKSPVDMIRLPSTSEEQNHLIETLKEKFKEVQDPSKVDATIENVGMAASLLNFYLAIQVDLSWLGLGKAVYIPVQITEREGGRKSVYCLDQNEQEVLTGIYVTSEGLALKFVKRETGSGLPAEKGSVYRTSIKNREGDLIFEGKEELLSFDHQTGIGSFSPLSGTVSPKVLSPVAGTEKASDIKPAICFFWDLVCV